jgi:hypothetical protein
MVALRFLRGGESAVEEVKVAGDESSEVVSRVLRRLVVGPASKSWESSLVLMRVLGAATAAGGAKLGAGESEIEGGDGERGSEGAVDTLLRV